MKQRDFYCNAVGVSFFYTYCKINVFQNLFIFDFVST